jgi:hypothetical protein
MNNLQGRPEPGNGVFLDSGPADRFVLEWLSKLQLLEPLRRNNIPVYPPTLVIGLGETGSGVLSQVKENLLERHLGQFPQDLHLLFIESSKILERGSSFLEAQEIINYRSDKDNLDYPSLSKRPYFEWLREAGNQPSLRAVERAKFFLSLQSREQSIVYQTLQKSVTAFRSVPQVFLIANLDEPESSPLWDIAFLLRHKVAEGFGIQMNSARLTAILAVNTGNSFSFDTSTDTFATIRELNRFLYNGFTRFIYPASELTGIADTALIDLCFLVDRKSSQKTSGDYYPADESGEMVRAISESLTILASPDNAIHQALQNSSEKSSNARDKYQQAFVSGIGVATFKLPVDDLRRAVELRLLRTLFFGGDSGQPAEGILPAPWASSKKPVPDDEISQKKAANFLRFELAGMHPIFAPISDILLLGKSGELGNLPVNLDDLFISKMTEWITRELNGSESLAFAGRSNSFPLVISYISALQRLLEQAQFTLRRAEKSRLSFEQSLNFHIDNWLAIVKQADSELTDWSHMLAGKPSFGEGERRRFSSRSQAGDGFSLLQLIEGDWFKARETLSSWVSSSVRKAPIDDGNNEPPFDGLEKPFFIRHIRPELNDKAGVRGDTLDKFSARVGWYCKNENGLKLYLLIASVTNDPQDGLSKTLPMLYARDQLEQAYGQLANLASYYSRGILEERLSSYLQPNTLPKVAEFLQEARSPMLPDNNKLEPLLVEPVGQHFLLTSDPRLAQKVENEFSYYTPQFVQQDAGVDFPQSITLISFHHVIALETTDVYSRAQNGYAFQPRAHIFVAEQHAAQVENELRNLLENPFLLHPQFIRIFEVGMPADNGTTSRYLPLANLFFKGWLFGLVHYDPALKVWRVPAVSDFQEVTVKAGAKDLFGAAQEFSLNMPYSSSLHISHPLAPNNISAYFQAFHRLLKKTSASDHNQLMKQLHETDQNQIQALLEQTDPIKHSLGAYLKYMVEEERFGGF